MPEPGERGPLDELLFSDPQERVESTTYMISQYQCRDPVYSADPWALPQTYRPVRSSSRDRNRQQWDADAIAGMQGVLNRIESAQPGTARSRGTIRFFAVLVPRGYQQNFAIGHPQHLHAHFGQKKKDNHIVANSPFPCEHIVVCLLAEVTCFACCLFLWPCSQ